MISNPIIEAMLKRKSIRKYTDEKPTDDVVESIVRAAQQAPFAGQLCSLLLSRTGKGHPFKAPLLFTVCVDCHKFEVIMKRRNWTMVTNDLLMLVFGLQDATLMAENLVMAAESVGMGSCFLGMAPYQATRIKEKYKLPDRVFPFVQLAVGYPAEDPPPRPRYPLDYFLFEDEYPEFTDEQVTEAMRVMDEGYMGQDYYRKPKLMIKLEGDRKETYDFDTYGWTEHICRKWGQWHPTPDDLLEQFAACGFHLTDKK